MGVFQKSLLLSFVLVCFSANIYGWTSETAVVRAISIKGNKVTREGIILRELEFKQGDTLFLTEIDNYIIQSRKNLLNLPLFHFVTIACNPSQLPGFIDFEVEVTERWYTWIWPVFELSDRNFNAWMKNGDLTRLSYGLFLQRENFRGRLEKLHVKIKLGYQQEAMLLYEKPYINRKKTLGAGFQVSVNRQRETGYITSHDKLIFYRADDFLLHSLDLSAFIRYRPDIHFSHTLQLRYNNIQASDSLLLLNPEFTPHGNKDPGFMELSYLLKADFRDQRAYPLHGWYGELLLSKTGLLQGDAYDFFSAKLLLRGYLRFNRNWHFAGSFTSRVMTYENLPYHLSQALGYRRDYVRGYEYYVVDGNNFWLAKFNLKYTLLKPSFVRLRWPETSKFNPVPYSLYLSAFVDAGKVWPDEFYSNNKMQEETLKGVGLGLDFITYYDKVVRAEFSVNARGESGFFLHFMAAI
jgi:outer membrane protein assembly factor BamA